MKNGKFFRHALIGVIAATAISNIHSAQAATVWTDWTSSTVDPAALDAFGTATGDLGTVTVTYSGELDGGYRINGDGFAPGTNTSVWAPESTYVGGAVTSSPVSINDYLRIDGFPEDGHVNTISFSSPVTNPLIAIWSLGDPTRLASITFDAIPLLQAGGPSTSIGGGAISVNGNTVSGIEGNGVVMFSGVFSSLSFTNTREPFYAFTVGSTDTPNLPAPGTLVLMFTGLAGLGLGRARRARPAV